LNPSRWPGCLAVALALELAGCHPNPSGAPARPAPGKSAAPAAAKAPVEPAPPASDAEQTEATAAIKRTLEFMAQLRELPALREVDGRRLTREEMVEHVERALAEEVPPEVLEATNAFLFLAGVVGSDFDYKRSLLSVLGTDLAGFYDPKAQRMYLGTDLAVTEQQATLAHELVHALQDQHYGLAALTEWTPDASDRMGALHSLAEGDATSAMLDAVLFGSGRTSLDLEDEVFVGQIEQMQNNDPTVPALVRRSVVAPYVDGLKFVHALRRKGGWSAVDAVWRRLPTTSEQILHPEKYFAGEAGVVVDVPGPSPKGPSTLLYRDVEGEQSLRLLFEEWLPRAEAAEAASDWGGDRLALYTEGALAAFAWHIRFDSAAAALRGYKGVLTWVRGTGLGVRGARAVCRERPDRGPLAASLRGADVVIVAGPTDRSSNGGQSRGSCADAGAWLAALGRSRP